MPTASTSFSVAAPSALHGSPRAPSGPVVVATAGDGDTAPLEVARRLATVAHASANGGVVVACAVEPDQLDLSAAGVPYVADVGERVGRVRAHLAAQLDSLGVAWPVDVVVDEPGRAVVDVARARHATLLVIGGGRHTALARLFGEVAIRALRRAPCPVLVVGREAMRVPPLVAVAAIDFSPSSVGAASAALDLLAPGGTLHLVHAWAPHARATPAATARDAAYERALPERIAHVERALRERTPRDVTLRSTALRGDPVETIVAFATAIHADLLAAGRQGHRTRELLLVGRVTASLVRAAQCAVLITPEPDPAARDALERALGGTSESRSAEEWAALLDAFSGRNAGRRTRLEVDDVALGAQTQEAGWPLLGAFYDRHDRRVTLMFGDPAGPIAHLTRAIPHVSAIAVLSDPGGHDVALRLTHGDAQTLLTFLPDMTDELRRAT